MKFNKKLYSSKINLGRIYINLTLNNTIITITDIKGNVCFWSSAGNNGFKGSRKKTSLAIQITAQTIVNNINKLGFNFLKIFIKRTGQGIETLLKIFKFNNLKILSIKDITPFSHNGCRLRKKRKV